MEGASQGTLVCRQGVWVEGLMGSDQGLPDMGKVPVDSGPVVNPGDMRVPVDSCVAETPEEICRTLGRCGVSLSISDRCDVVRDVECSPDICESGQICDQAAGVCEAACTPDPCPTTPGCTLIPDGCGEMQLCEQCTAGTACDADTMMCACTEEAVLQVLCEGKCGRVSNTLADTCFEEVTSWQCPSSCEAGACNLSTNTCADLEVLSHAMPLANERFGASLSLDGDYLMVGAPGELTNYLGNLYIYSFKPGAEPEINVRQSIDLGPNYEGHEIGSAVAINRSGIALPGKQNPRAPSLTNKSLNLLANIGGTWQRSTTLDGEDESAGMSVATARNYFVVGAPRANSRAGAVTLYTIDTSSQTIPSSRSFTTSSEVGLGSAMAMTNTQLILGAPGTNNGQGSCRVSRVSADLTMWSNSSSIITQSSGMEGLCRTVALQTNLAAIGARRLIPSSTSGFDVVHLYESNNNGVDWSFTQEIENPGKRDDGSFGQSLALSDDKTFLFVGDPLLDLPELSLAGAGAVHVYQRIGNSSEFAHVDTIRSNNPRKDGHFGQALATSSTTRKLYIGAPDERVMSNENAGIVYVYDYP